MSNSLVVAGALIVFGGAGLVASILQTVAVPAAERRAYSLAMTVGDDAPAGHLACRSVYRVSSVTVGRECRGRGAIALAD